MASETLSLVLIYIILTGEYEQNLCVDNTSCQPCQQRLPSCRGLHDGINAVSGQLWTQRYIECYLNRTISVQRCTEGLFDPFSLLCTNTIRPGKCIDCLNGISVTKCI